MRRAATPGDCGPSLLRVRLWSETSWLQIQSLVDLYTCTASADAIYQIVLNGHCHRLFIG